MIERIKRNPVLLASFISAILLLIVNFGVPITDNQSNAILNVITTFGVLLGVGSITRSAVVPYKDVVTYVDAEGSLVTGPAE